MGKSEISLGEQQFTSPWPPLFPCGLECNFQARAIDGRHQLIISESAQTQERKVSSAGVFIWPDDNALIEIETKGSPVRAHLSALQI